MPVTTAAGFNRPRFEATASSTRSWCTSSTAKTRRPFTAALHRPGFESWTPSFTRPTSSSFFFSFSFSISSALKLWRRLHQRSHWARASAKNFLISGSVKDLSAEKRAEQFLMKTIIDGVFVFDWKQHWPEFVSCANCERRIWPQIKFCFQRQSTKKNFDSTSKMLVISSSSFNFVWYGTDTWGRFYKTSLIRF